jgi:hypothetical protein
MSATAIPLRPIIEECDCIEARAGLRSLRRKEHQVRRVKVLLRGVAIMALGLVLALPGTVTPAHAEDGGVDYSKLVDILVDAFTKGADGGYSPAEIIEMVQNLVNAVNGVKGDVLSGLSGKVEAQIYSQMEAAITKIPTLKVPFLRGVAINSIHDAAYLAKGQVTQDYADAPRDAIGRAMITLFTSLNTAYIQVDAEQIARGVPSNLAGTNRPYFRQGLEDLVRLAAPQCSEGGLANAGYFTYTCRFADKTMSAEFWAGNDYYTINGGPHIPGFIDHGHVQNVTMKDTVRPIAQRQLDELKRENVPLP